MYLDLVPPPGRPAAMARFAPLFLVCLTLAARPVSVSAAMPGLPAGKPGAAGDDLFTNSVIPRLEIKVPEEGLRILREYSFRQNTSQSDREDARATVREGDQVYTNVAIHLKGAYGSFRSVDDNPALTLNFDKFASGQRFHGLQKVSLNNSVQDTSFITEKLCREIYVRAGVPTPRADYVTVTFNGRNLGLRVLVEGWNKQFLKRYYPDAAGNLYDSPVVAEISPGLMVASGDKPTDHSGLNALLEAARIANPERRWKRLQETLDVDRFVSVMALDALMWNWDGYMLNRNNYRLFHDRSTGRMVFFPHGLDQMFWRAEGPVVPGPRGIVGRAVMETPEGRRLYLERLGEVRSNLLEVAVLTNRVHALAARIQPAVRRSGLGVAARFGMGVRTVLDRIERRDREVAAQLAGLAARPVIAPGDTLVLTNWIPKVIAGWPVFGGTNQSPPTLEVTARDADDAGAWVTTVWLEPGRYRLEGRARTRGLTPALNRDAGEGAWLRVWSRRKFSEGPEWDWFPFRQSRDVDERGVIPATVSGVNLLLADSDWTSLACEFELRQPLADLEFQAELRSPRGTASFDPASFRLRRLSGRP